ncbi:MAG: RHS repeat-associated core domain-containing protein [Clostridia bacterium]|nr:RHS repeat-associated core domain-containing protein [Clostridia bacterium]
METADFTYYADGLRKTKDGELYIYDGKNVLAEIDNTDIRLNVYGNTLLFTIQGTITTENEVTFIDGKIAYAYEFNLHGDVVKVLGIAGIVLNTYTYDAFGVIVQQSETVGNTFYYAGYQYDSETGLYYLRSRYYNAETARFITEDSFNGYYNDPLSLNRYTYCHNSPIIYFDPDGFRACDITAYTEIEGYSKEEILEITIERIKEENELVMLLQQH